eukprot:TRINITY_DN2415_c0_g1_i1.p1 TRINITY_DN2415_c0_g1~~TRINITY_DN2415_c0_g1_i1.p1  ORF type:complete len:632 (+),score=181.52 TRINITY_DN2415_c0_g1_i1:137-2032(+)
MCIRDRIHMARVLSLSGLQLSSSQILDIVQAADLNGDGVIDHAELVPMAREVLLAWSSSEDDSETDSGSENGHDEYDWTEIPEDELEGYLRKLFLAADENQDGVLQPSEFVDLMRMSALKFPDDMILEGFQEADTNGDGVTSSEELLKWSMEALSRAKAVPERLAFSPSALTAEQLEGYLRDLFSVADTNGDGVLQPKELTKLLSLCGFELSSSQILDIVQAADLNGDGVIDHAELVPVARAILHSLSKEDPETDSESDSEDVKYDWTEIPEPQLEGYLRKLFLAADENQDGVLQPSEFVDLMRMSALKFPDDMILEGFQEADTNGDGVVDSEELLTFVLNTVNTLNGGPVKGETTVFSEMLRELVQKKSALKPAQAVEPKPWSPDPLYEAHVQAGKLFDSVDAAKPELSRADMKGVADEKLFGSEDWSMIWRMLQPEVTTEYTEEIASLSAQKDAAVAVEDYLEAARCKAEMGRLSALQDTRSVFSKEAFMDAYTSVWAQKCQSPVSPPPAALSFVEEFQALVTDADFSDIVFVVEGLSIYYSRMVLCSRNATLREMFMPGNKWSDENLGYTGGQLRRIVLEGVSAKAMLAVLQFIYCGECPEMGQETRSGVERLAVDFHLGELIEQLRP